MLVFGAGGQLGREFMRALSEHGCDCSGVERAPGDGLHSAGVPVPQSLAERVLRDKPAVVINAVAYTAVDRAEQEPEPARVLNARVPEALAAACRTVGALMVHFSTDYVFDGRKASPYVETDPVSPLNRYGETKALGDQAVCASGAAHLVLRTSWLYTPGGRNFVATMLRLFRGTAPVRVVDDQFGCPTWARCLAQALVHLLAREDAGRVEAASGLYHLCGGGETSWYGLARAIYERAVPRARAELIPIDTAEFGAPVARPAYSVLDCTRARDVLGTSLPHWLEQLETSMPEFNARDADGR